MLLELYRFQNGFFYISLFNRDSVTQNKNFAFIERKLFKYTPPVSWAFDRTFLFFRTLTNACTESPAS